MIAFYILLGVLLVIIAMVVSGALGCLIGSMTKYLLDKFTGLKILNYMIGCITGFASFLGILYVLCRLIEHFVDVIGW